MANILKKGSLYRILLQEKRSGMSHTTPELWPAIHLAEVTKYKTSKECVIWDMRSPLYYMPMLFLYTKSLDPIDEHPSIKFVRKNPIFLIEDKLYKTFAINIKNSDQYFELLNAKTGL